MVGFAELSKMNIFTMDDVSKLTGNLKTASSLVLRLSKKGYIKKIKNNLYTCVNVADGQIVASKYHIACAINETAYLSHHSAFEYMGLSNQVFYELYVSSSKRFTTFEFEDLTYRYVPSKCDEGVICPKNTQGIRVTSIERTVVDSIKDFERIAGLEELLNCVSNITFLDENQLKKYLDSYNMQFLYQKTGFILKNYEKQFRLSDEFVNYCKSKIGKSTRYLTKDSSKYLSEWKLIVPEGIFELTEQGGVPVV